MILRIYYKVSDDYMENGTILLVVIEGQDEWNLLEHGCAVGVLNSKFAQFELTEENLEKYMEGPDRVNTETIKEVELKKV